MKKIILIVLLAMIAVGCSKKLKQLESEYTIRVTGSSDVAFKGNYSFPSADSLSKPINIEGVVPAEFTGRGVTALCMFRKTVPDGTLKIELMKDNTLIRSSETSAPYGLVSISNLPDKESFYNMVLGKIFDMLKL
jgi:hypothetical protein